MSEEAADSQGQIRRRRDRKRRRVGETWPQQQQTLLYRVEEPPVFQQQQPHFPVWTTRPLGEAEVDATSAPTYEMDQVSQHHAVVDLWRYMMFLSIGLFLWLLYLILPKGFRKHVCQADRRRHLRRNGANQRSAARSWEEGTFTSGGGSFVTASPRYHSELMRQGRDPLYRQRVQREVRQRQVLLRDLSFAKESASASRTLGSSTMMSGETMTQRTMHSASQFSASPPRRPDRYSDDLGSWSAAEGPTPTPSVMSSRLSASAAPGSTGHSQTFHMADEMVDPLGAQTSPVHPAISRVPSLAILQETHLRLQKRGIRLVAHGVHCDPKRVWIRVEYDAAQVPTQITWQTEFPRRIPNQSGEASIVLMRGSVHRISVEEILYIDVGKKTHALVKATTTPGGIDIPDSCCFSLLTQNGSLDLQTNSMLERDALVSCFCQILDQAHNGQDWRALYEESSAATSSYAASSTTDLVRSDMVEV